MNGVINNCALAIFILLGSWLSLIDLRSHRLPNSIVFSLSGALIALALVSPQRSDILNFALLHTGIYLALYLISRQQLGLGDVRYAFPVGLITGFYSQDLLLLISLTFGVAAFVSLLLMTCRKLHLHSRLAFGPFMTVAALITILLAN